MDGLERENNSLTFLDKCWVAAEATMNASCIDRNGNSHKVMNTAIDTKGITTLAEYMRFYDITKMKNLDPSKQDNEKLMSTYVIPVTLQTGEKIDVIINQKGQDMACVFLDKEGKQNGFAVTPRMQKEILASGMKNIEGIINTEIAKEGLIPKTLEEFEEEVSKDTLVPKTSKETVAKIKEKLPDADIKEIEDGREDNEQTLEKSNQEEKELPSDVKDAVAKFREKYKGGKLKQILEVDDPSSINEKLDGNTGIMQNGGKVHCLRFADSGAGMGDKVIMIQGDRIIENSKYDSDMTELMNDKTAESVRTLEDNDSKLYYTDSEGNTIEYDLVASPKDLSLEEKQQVGNQMQTLESELEAKREEAERLQAEIEKIASNIEQYEGNEDSEIERNVLEPARGKLEELQDSLSSVYSDISNLNQEKAQILSSKGLDHIAPAAKEDAKRDEDEIGAFEVPGKREH